MRCFLCFVAGISWKQLLSAALYRIMRPLQQPAKSVVEDSDPIGYELVTPLSEGEAPTEEDWSMFESIDKETWAHDSKAPKERSNV